MSTVDVIEVARQRRHAQAARGEARVEWFIDEVSTNIRLSIDKRVKLGTEFLRNRVVINISRPVTKTVGSHGRIVITNRSKKGEFPKADTTLLMKSIFRDTNFKTPGLHEGFVGTPVDYGLILEIVPKLDRSFLVRTLWEEWPRIKKLLLGPLE